MRNMFASAYTPEMAGKYRDRYGKILHVRDFSRQIDESIRTYFCGYTFNAVTGRLPVVEGIIRKMATRQNRTVGQGTKTWWTSCRRLSIGRSNHPTAMANGS